jgi:hypothetical protein
MVLGTNHTVGDKLENGFTAIFAFIPELIAALLILVIGYFVAKIVAGVLTKGLRRAGLDRTATSGQGGQWVSKVTTSPSWLVGRVAFWVLLIGAISLAVTALGIDALTDFVGAIFAYLPNVIAALLIFLVAGAIAGAVAAIVTRTMGDTPTGKVVASVVPILIMAIAGFMILDQLKIAETIVTITYAALIGAIALGCALAFGLGGRDVAARMLEGAYQKGQESSEQVKRDVRTGREQAKVDLETAKSAAQDRVEGDAVSGPPARSETSAPVAAGAPSTAATERVERVPANEVDAVPPGTVDPIDRR